MTLALSLLLFLASTCSTIFRATGENQPLTHTEVAAAHTSSNDVWIVIVCLSLVFIVSGCMFSFYCCGKWFPSTMCCCCPSRDDESEECCCPIKTGERDKLIGSEEVVAAKARPPNPLIPKKKKNMDQPTNEKSDEEDSDDIKQNNKVKITIIPTNPSIKIPTISLKRSRSPSPANFNTSGEPRSRSSSPRAPAFDVVTDPSNPLLRMK